jgi:outer membrane lipoprotein SlyB
MKQIISMVVLVTMVVVGGCARHKTVIIDPAGVDMGLYQRDLSECQQIAQQVDSQVGEGAIGGAVVGGLVGAIIGGPRSAERTAGVGAVLGGAKGAGSTKQEKELVLKNCLRNRGYRVLN